MPSQHPVGTSTPTPRHQSGVTLLEVLIAVFILSMGFLGMAALQLRSLSTNDSAMTRSMAVIAANTILDALRSDRTRAIAGDYNTTVKADACSGSGTLAKVQLYDWCSQLGANLGATSTTTGTISCSSVGLCTVTIQFDDSRSGTGGVSNQQVTIRTRI